MKWIAAAALAAVGLIAQDASTDVALDKAKQLTVMINATIDGDTKPGAGIIFALANNQVYIATANHLVRRSTSQASDIQAEFQWLPGQPVPAQLLTYYDDRALDLAVIVIDFAKAHLGQAQLPFDRFGDSSKLTRGSPVSAIGYPNGKAYDVSTGQISQIEAVSLKYRVAGLVPGGYSGGPLLDRDGMIVGMIGRDQPPDGLATRIDLILQQLKAWNYQVGLREEPSRASGSDFQGTLLRYIQEAPQGFRSLGAKQFGNWNPSINLPDAVSCRGGGTAREPFIECILYRTSSEAEATDKFDDLIDIVQAALPAWKGERLNLFNGYFRSASQPKVNVALGVSHSGADYDVKLSVRRSE